MPRTAQDVIDNPKAGDVLKSKHYFKPFTVLEIGEDGTVCGRFEPSLTEKGALCGLKFWRDEWAKNAEVIHAAD